MGIICLTSITTTLKLIEARQMGNLDRIENNNNVDVDDKNNKNML